MVLRIFLGVVLFLTSEGAWSLSLADFLKEVEERNFTSRALVLEQEAAAEKQVAGDLELTPMLTVGTSYQDDRKQPSSAILGAQRVFTQEYNFGLAKNFSTGTQLSLFGKVNEMNAKFSDYQTALSIASLMKFKSGPISPDDPKLTVFGSGMGISLSQSLWKNSFGHATQLRWEREASQSQAEKGSYDLRRRQVLMDSEIQFWNYIAAQELLKMRRASLERAQKMEAWIQRRVRDGIGDKSDLFNAQSLVESRRLELINIEDELTGARAQIMNVLNIKEAQDFPKLSGSLDTRRPLDFFLTGANKKIVRLDAYLSFLEAKTKAVVAREIEDGMRPDLSLDASYNTNIIAQAGQGNLNTVANNMTDGTNPTARVSLTLKYFFDSDAKLAKRSSASKEFASSKLIAEQKLGESETSWIELNRRYLEMSKRVEIAEKVAKFQSGRAKEESDKLAKGRTVTSNAITAAQDADEAQLRVTQMKVEQRKMEAQGRMFVSVDKDLSL